MNEDPNARRTRHVTEYFADQIPQVGEESILRLDAFPVERWAGSPTGWDPPYLHAEGQFMFPHCPELIGFHTADLFVDDVDAHLRAVVVMAFLHVEHYEVPIEERIPMIEKILGDTHPPSLELLMFVELATL